MSPVYQIGGPTSWLRDISFPKRKPLPNIVQPWFWWITPQTPKFFAFLGGVWGPGWVCREILPVIKILAIDTQPIQPSLPVGLNSVEEFIDKTNAGVPVSQDAWGRFFWDGPHADGWWWKVTTGKSGRQVPEYTIKKGVPTERTDRSGKPVGTKPLALQFQDAVHNWRDFWNAGAEANNAATSAVTNSGYQCVLPNNGGFFVPGPNQNETLPDLAQHLGVDQYYGAVPIEEIFASGQPFIFKQAWAFKMNVAQLDPFEWDFTFFPPKRTSLSQFDGGSGNPPFAATLDASANNPSILAGILPPFPQNSPIIVQ